jgi:hypothetical protein
MCYDHISLTERDPKTLRTMVSQSPKVQGNPLRAGRFVGLARALPEAT